MVNLPAPKPCASCPYRQDAPSGLWAAEEYDKLPRYDADMPFQPVEVFACHQTDRNTPGTRLCAGWVAAHGPENLLSLRIAASSGHIPAEDMPAVWDYTTSVPVFATGAEAAAHGIRDIDAPGVDAERAISKIIRRRKDIRLKGDH